MLDYVVMQMRKVSCEKVYCTSSNNTVNYYMNGTVSKFLPPHHTCFLHCIILVHVTATVPAVLGVIPKQ